MISELLPAITISTLIGVILGYLFGGWIPSIGTGVLIICAIFLVSKSRVLPILGFMYGLYAFAFTTGGLIGAGILGKALIQIGSAIS